MKTDLPPRPDQAEAPEPLTTAPARNTRRLWIIGAVLALGITALAVPALMGNTTETGDSGSITAPADTGIEAVDLDAVIQHSEESSRLMGLSADASTNLDLPSAATYMQGVADEWATIETLWQPVPEMAALAGKVADHYQSAASFMADAVTAIDAGRIGDATSLVEVATAEINAAGTDLDAATRLAETYLP